MTAAPFLDFGPLMQQVELLQASVEHYEFGRDEAAHLLTSVQQVVAALQSVEFSAEVLVAAAERKRRTARLRQDVMLDRLGGRPGDAA